MHIKNKQKVISFTYISTVAFLDHLMQLTSKVQTPITFFICEQKHQV